MSVPKALVPQVRPGGTGWAGLRCAPAHRAALALPAPVRRSMGLPGVCAGAGSAPVLRCTGMYWYCLRQGPAAQHAARLTGQDWSRQRPHAAAAPPGGGRNPAPGPLPVPLARPRPRPRAHPALPRPRDGVPPGAVRLGQDPPAPMTQRTGLYWYCWRLRAACGTATATSHHVTLGPVWSGAQNASPHACVRPALHTLRRMLASHGPGPLRTLHCFPILLLPTFSVPLPLFSFCLSHTVRALWGVAPDLPFWTPIRCFMSRIVGVPESQFQQRIWAASCPPFTVCAPRIQGAVNIKKPACAHGKCTRPLCRAASSNFAFRLHPLRCAVSVGDDIREMFLGELHALQGFHPLPLMILAWRCPLTAVCCEMQWERGMLVCAHAGCILLGHYCILLCRSTKWTVLCLLCIGTELLCLPPIGTARVEVTPTFLPKPGLCPVRPRPLASLVVILVDAALGGLRRGTRKYAAAVVG